jgi:hypothetical protein
MSEFPGHPAALIQIAERFLQDDKPMPVDLTARLLEAGIDVSELTPPELDTEHVPDWLAVLSIA